MAISRGAGTEIIRTALFKTMDSTAQDLIIGVQHHIYTVLSITIHAQTWQASGNKAQVRIDGYDAKGGTTAQSIIIFNEALSVGQTFVWNDKFSFNGFEPTNFTGPLDNGIKQDAIADQGSSVAQKLRMATTHADDAAHVTITYIDQNNA